MKNHVSMALFSLLIMVTLLFSACPHVVNNPDDDDEDEVIQVYSNGLKSGFTVETYDVWNGTVDFNSSGNGRNGGDAIKVTNSVNDWVGFQITGDIDLSKVNALSFWVRSEASVKYEKFGLY